MTPVSKKNINPYIQKSLYNKYYHIETKLPIMKHINKAKRRARIIIINDHLEYPCLNHSQDLKNRPTHKTHYYVA